jgi:glycosyltransferase involved in cell wall biosynthesis
MKILMLTASLPYPPQQGGALRSFGILRGLHQSGHQVTLLSFHDEADKLPEESAPLFEFCQQIETVKTPTRSRNQRLHDLVFSAEPDIARRLYSDEFLKRLTGLLNTQEYDLVQFEGIEVACFMRPLKQQATHAKLCYDAFNAEAALQRVIFEVDRTEIRRWPAAAYSFLQSRRIAHFERELCEMADLVIAVSGEDATILCQYRPDQSIQVVANGIFADEYAHADDQLDLGPHALVFTGKMDYRPNVDAVFWFSEQILPIIRSSIPDVKLYIVGQKPHVRLEKLRDKPGIEITGWVQDVQPFLRGASVYVAPLRMGSGTRLKILEAMASGCAVVATRIATSGMSPEVSKSVIIRDTPDQMAEAIISLLQEPERRAALKAEACSFVAKNYDWSVLIPRLLAAYREIGLG